MYTIAVLLLPILFMYSIGIETITVGDVFLLLALIMLLLFPERSNGVVRTNNKSIAILFLPYILVVSFFYVVSGESTSILFTSLRYGFYVLCSFFFFRIIDFDYVITVYKKIVIFCTVLMYIQTICYRLFNIAIPGVLQFLSLTDDSLYDYLYVINHHNSRRCMSVFAEPSHYAIYVLPLILVLLYKWKKFAKHPLALLLFVSGGIIISATFTGILGLLCCFLIYCAYEFFRTKVNIQRVLLFIGLVFCALFIFRIPFIKSYIFNNDIFSRQSSGRFSGYGYIFALKQNVIQVLFGNGMNDIGKFEDLYLAGWPRLYYYYGFLGSILSVCYFFSFKKKNALSISVLLLLAVMMVGTEINVSSFLLPYLLLMVTSNESNVKGDRI